MILKFCALVTLVAALTFPLSFSGRVARVDYTNSVIVVRTSAGERSVSVMPSTEIDSRLRGGYASISDIRPGTLVDVTASDAGGHIVAQIIRIR